MNQVTDFSKNGMTKSILIEMIAERRLALQERINQIIVSRAKMAHLELRGDLVSSFKAKFLSDKIDLIDVLRTMRNSFNDGQVDKIKNPIIRKHAKKVSIEIAAYIIDVKIVDSILRKASEVSDDELVYMTDDEFGYVMGI